MACVEGIETESAFLAALKRVNGWRIDGRGLELLDGAGNAVARFEAERVERPRSRGAAAREIGGDRGCGGHPSPSTPRDDEGIREPGATGKRFV